MITKLKLIKEVCRNAGFARRNPAREYLTKEELMKINVCLSSMKVK